MVFCGSIFFFFFFFFFCVGFFFFCGVGRLFFFCCGVFFVLGVSFLGVFFFFFFVIFRGETLYSGGESRHFVERSGVLWEKMSSSLCGRESSVWRRR